MAIRAIEFYSGIGGLHRALSLSNVDATVIRAFDWDQTSCRVYEQNYGPGIVDKLDISSLTTEAIITLEAQLWLMSPSCQPYTVLNPSAKGAEDPRAKSFLHLIQNILPRLVESGKGPQWLLIENVAGFEGSKTREVLLKILDETGYESVELLLNPLQYGIPNSRLRYYLLAKVRPKSFSGVTLQDSRRVWRRIPSDPEMDSNECSVTELRHYLDCDEDESLRIPDRVLTKWGRLFDIVLPSSRRTCCFTRGYTQLVERAGSILQTNEELDTTHTFDEFLAQLEKESATPVSLARDSDPSAVSILYPLGLRYFSPLELLRLFHFVRINEVNSADSPVFVWPDGVSKKSKYRLLGNSVNVEVVKRLINYLFEAQSTVN